MNTDDMRAEERNQRLLDIKAMLEDKNYEAFDENFLDLHPYDQGLLFEGLSSYQRKAVYYLLTPKEMAELFDIMEEDNEYLEVYFSEMESEYAADLLNEMYVDNAVDVLDQLDEAVQENLFDHMDNEDSTHFQLMLTYGEDTAGSIMTTEFIAFEENLTLAETTKQLRELVKEAESIYYLYVVDENDHLQGVVSMRDLLLNNESVYLHDLMNTDIRYIDVDTDQEDAAHIVREYNFLALPVVDHDRRLIGVITVDDIVDVIDDEASEDYSGLAGVDVEDLSDSPVKASQTRLPWLMALLVLGLGTSTLISAFEGMLAEAAILAAFISLITGTAGNAGTQSLAVAVRRLSNVSDRDLKGMQLFVRELFTGLITGFIMGIFAFLIIWLWQQNIFLGIVVGAALAVAVLISTLAGTYIPILIDKMGFDPAVASGPFITTLTDLTSVVIYFSIAQVFLPYLV